MLNRSIPPTGIVIIGRNEGELLRRCLLSVINLPATVVYADSGSTDESVNLARELGAAVVPLEASQPFTAARGRNAGFTHLLKIAPKTQYVQFIDGDCELIEGWLETGINYLQEHLQYAIVCGRLQERNPQLSVYNRLFDMEWQSAPIGDIEFCGGIFLMRTIRFAEIHGMNDTIAAGEEPEMCFRLRNQGWRLARLEQQMARHDVNILSFSQWWKRCVRSGQGALEVYTKTNRQTFSKQIRRARMWTLGFPGIIVVLLFTTNFLPRVEYILIPFSIFLLYPIQIVRLSCQGRSKGLNALEAVIYGSLMILGKWAEFYGQIIFYLKLLRHKKN